MWTRDNYLETKLKEYYTEKAKPRIREKLSVSDTGCLLHRELKMWGIKPDREQSLQEAMTFDFGNMVHWFLQKRLEDMEILEVKEMELEDDLVIGHADALVRENGKLVVYEFKSIKDYGLDRIMTEGKPQDNHIKQLMGYWRLMRNLGVDNLADYGKIVYLAKCFDDGHRSRFNKAAEKVSLRFEEFRGDYDENLAKEIEEENTKVWDAVKANKPLLCSEWGTSYHRDGNYNQYLSWCSIRDEKTLQERLDKELKNE